MTFETEFYSGAGYAGFKTICSASEIAQAYTSGENVIVHFPPALGYGNHDSYARMVGYAPACEAGGSNSGPTFVFAGTGNPYTWNTYSVLSTLYQVDVDANGKLDFHYTIY